MLYRLVNSKKQSPWQVEYERLYQKYLKIKPRDISIEDLESGKVIVRRGSHRLSSLQDYSSQWDGSKSILLSSRS